MRKSTRMLFMRNGSRRGGNRDGYADYRYDDYPESRFRDRRGREHYDNGRYAPQSRYVPPVYDYPMYNYPMYEEREMQPIGFRFDDYNTRGRGDYVRGHGAGYVGDELRGERERMMGHAGGYGGVMPMDKHTAKEWAEHMKNADDTTGAHWTMEQTEQVMRQYGIQCEPAEFYAVMNMMYSDYCEVFKKFGVNKMDFYAEISKAFICDEDAQPDKTARYYDYIAKH